MNGNDYSDLNDSPYEVPQLVEIGTQLNFRGNIGKVISTFIVKPGKSVWKRDPFRMYVVELTSDNKVKYKKTLGEATIIEGMIE